MRILLHWVSRMLSAPELRVVFETLVYFSCNFLKVVNECLLMLSSIFMVESLLYRSDLILTSGKPLTSLGLRSCLRGICVGNFLVIKVGLGALFSTV